MQVNRQIFTQFEQYLRSYEWISIQFEHIILEFERNNIKKGKNKERILSTIDQLEKELRVLIDYFLKFDKDLVVKDLKVHESFFKNVSYDRFIRDSEKHVKELFRILEKTRKTVSDSWNNKKKVLMELKFFHKENHHWLRIFNRVALGVRETEKVFSEHGLRYYDDPHFPFRYFYSRDCGETAAHYTGLVETTYSFLSRTIGELKSRRAFGKLKDHRIFVYFLNSRDWHIPEFHIMVPYGIGRCEYYGFFGDPNSRSKNPFVINLRTSRILFPKDFAIEAIPIGRQMLSILPFLVCHEITHLFLFEHNLWVSNMDMAEICCNLVAFRVGRARMHPIMEIVKEAVRIAKREYPGKTWAYFAPMFYEEGPKSKKELQEFGYRYIFLQTMLWQAIIIYYEQHGFGNLIQDTKGVRRVLDTIKW